MLTLLALLGTVQGGALFQMGLKNYTEVKRDNLPLLVLYSGQDRNSLRFREEFIQIARGTHEVSQKQHIPNELNYGMVDTKAEAKLMEKTQIRDIPAAYIFLTEDTKVKYGGAWNALSFVSWVKRTLRDNPDTNIYAPSALITSVQQMANKFRMFNQVAVLYTPDYRLGPLKAFVNASKQIPEGYVFCHVHDPQITQILKVQPDESSLIVYSKLQDVSYLVKETELNKFATYFYKYDGDLRDVNRIKEFMLLYTWKGFYHFDDGKFQKMTYRSDRKPTVALVYNSSVEGNQPYIDAIERARYTLYKKAVVGLADVQYDVKDRIEKLFIFNISTDLPKLIVIKPLDDDRFDRFVSDSLDPNVAYEQVMTGQIQPFHKNQQLSESELYDGAGIRKLTYETYYPFIKDANDQGQDVFVVYTAKICVPCRNQLPEYHSLYKKVKNVLADRVIFTRFDMALNDIDFQIDNYPHIKLYKAGKDQPIPVVKGYLEEQLHKFLVDNSNHGHLLVKKPDL